MAFDTTPNVIVVLADDLGYGDLGFTGHPYARTPNIDRMSQEGTVLDQFRVCPTCSPTRGTMMTGRNSYRFGITDAFKGFLPDQEITIAETLKANPNADYLTGAFGKWHMSTTGGKGYGATTAERSAPWYQGFDTSFITQSEVPTYTYTDNKSAYFTGPGKTAQAPKIGDSSEIIVDQVVPFLNKAVAADRPFFAYVAFNTPHNPVVADPNYVGNFTGKFDAAYQSNVQAMDAQIGRLRQNLERLGQTDNTMILFTSDNGPKAGKVEGGSTGGLRGGKQTLWDGGVRMPSIFLYPQLLPNPQKLTTAVGVADVLPTIAELTGSPAPKNRPMDGISFASFLTTKQTTGFSPRRPDENKIFGKYLGKASVVDNSFKAVRDSSTGAWTLFNITDDPFETKNLAKDSFYSSKVAQYKLEWTQWNDSVANSLTGADYLTGL